MNKAELRESFLARRKQLSETACAALNLQLYQLFFTQIDLSFVRVLHTYLPIAANHEPDTWQLLDRIRREFPHIRIVLPKVKPGGLLENIYFEGMHQLETNTWGISEPRQGVPAPANAFDIVIVPLLAFDHRGHRVGYGKGYYDRLLKDCRPDCRKIGLSFFEGVERIDDAGPLDQTLSDCLTPAGLIHF